MTDGVAGPRTNLLLASVPAERRPWSRRLEVVSLDAEEVLYEVCRPVDSIYFPLKGCAISVVRALDDGNCFDAGLVGYEGLVGVEALLGIPTAQFRVVVRVGGEALRIRADDLRDQMGGGWPEVLRAYVQFLLLLFTQKAGCNRFHRLDKHLGSMLLAVHDRINGDEFVVTQSILARMIGVRRVGITQAARKLQQAGLIRYSWGKLTILDRRKLKAYACVCYQQQTEAYRRLLDPAWPHR